MKFTELLVITTSHFVKIILFKLFTMVDAQVRQLDLNIPPKIYIPQNKTPKLS